MHVLKMGNNIQKCKRKTLTPAKFQCYITGMTIAKAKTVAELRKVVKAWHDKGLKVGLVPTMGALHAGHMSLLEAILKKVDRVVVSIFVNPTQFGEGEDFDSYPRAEGKDCEKLRAAGAHLVFLPAVSEMYGKGPATVVRVDGLSEVLCGRFRPGHFEGVATVVAKLLLQCLPDSAIFGEKDFQQLQVIRKLVSDLYIPVEILAAPTKREADGLAISSRNAYLSGQERKIAAALPAAMNALIYDAKGGKDLRRLEKEGQAALLLKGFDSIDYLEFREAGDLSLSRKAGRSTRLFAAARIGKTRLIDNMKVI